MVVRREKDQFIGDWQLEKEITSLDGDYIGKFLGEARFSDKGEHVHYMETGALTLQNGVFQAERRYIWRFMADEIHVFFEDMRPFHTINLHDEDRHYCGQDVYDVTYDFSELPRRWEASWKVTGPRKNTMIQNIYSKI